MGAFCETVNRNKRGIVIDIRTHEGVEVIKSLLPSTDVLLEGFAPGTMEKIGLGYLDVQGINPRLMYCSISGYGQDGPYKLRKGYDACAQAESGIMEAVKPSSRVGPSYSVDIQELSPQT